MGGGQHNYILQRGRVRGWGRKGKRSRVRGEGGGGGGNVDIYPDVRGHMSHMEMFSSNL